MLEKTVEIDQAIGIKAWNRDNKKEEGMVLREMEPTSLSTSHVRSRGDRDASSF